MTCLLITVGLLYVLILSMRYAQGKAEKELRNRLECVESTLSETRKANCKFIADLTEIQIENNELVTSWKKFKDRYGKNLDEWLYTDRMEQLQAMLQGSSLEHTAEIRVSPEGNLLLMIERFKYDLGEDFENAQENLKSCLGLMANHIDKINRINGEV